MSEMLYNNLIKFFSKTKIDTLKECENLSICLRFYNCLKMIISLDYNLQEDITILTCLENLLAVYSSNDNDIFKNETTYIWKNRCISVALQVKELWHAYLDREDKFSCPSTIKEICENFCAEYADLSIEWQEEIQKYRKAQKRITLFCMALLAFEISLGMEACFTINDEDVSFKSNCEISIDENLDSSLSIEEEVINSLKRTL